MELHELHVHQIRASFVGQGMTVAGVLPTVARDTVGSANTPGCQDNRRGVEPHEAPPLPIEAERSGHTAVIFQQRRHGAFHVDFDPLMDSMILKRADHFEAGTVADVGQAGVPVSAEVPLQYSAVDGPVEHCSPGFEFANAFGSFLRVQLGHLPATKVLSTAHGVREVDLPVVVRVDCTQRCRNAALGHHRVGFSEKRFANQAHSGTGR